MPETHRSKPYTRAAMLALVLSPLAALFGVQREARAITYTATNVTVDRALNADATSVDELADVLGTLILDLKAGRKVT